MENTSFMRVEEVAQELGVSKSYAYKIVQKLNMADKLNQFRKDGASDVIKEQGRA